MTAQQHQQTIGSRLPIGTVGVNTPPLESIVVFQEEHQLPEGVPVHSEEEKKLVIADGIIVVGIQIEMELGLAATILPPVQVPLPNDTLLQCFHLQKEILHMRGFQTKSSQLQSMLHCCLQNPIQLPNDQLTLGVADHPAL